MIWISALLSLVEFAALRSLVLRRVLERRSITRSRYLFGLIIPTYYQYPMCRHRMTLRDKDWLLSHFRKGRMKYWTHCFMLILETEIFALHSFWIPWTAISRYLSNFSMLCYAMLCSKSKTTMLKTKLFSTVTLVF